MIPLQMYPILLKFVPSALLQKQNFQSYPELVHICYKLFLSETQVLSFIPFSSATSISGQAVFCICGYEKQLYFS